MPPEVTVPRRGHRRSSIRVHFAPAINEEDSTRCNGILVTSVARTLLDLAATVAAPRLERAIERSEQLRLFDLRAVDSLLERASHHHGAGALRKALSLYQEPPMTRSQLERLFLGLAREAGLPAPSVNHFVAGYEVDMYWEDKRFAVELDGFEYHRTRAAFERDRLREEELALAGIETIRLTERRLRHDSRRAMRRLAMLLKQRP
jgi:hypothetical protein